AGDRHLTVADQRLDAAARQVGGEAGGKPLVEALAGCVAVGGQLFQCGRGFAIRIAPGPTRMTQPMAGVADEDEGQNPPDPAVERVRGKLVRFMIINLGLLFLALMAVVIAIVYRSGSRQAPPVAAAPELPLPAPGEVLGGDIVLPEGARIAGHALFGNRVSL